MSETARALLPSIDGNPLDDEKEYGVRGRNILDINHSPAWKRCACQEEATLVQGDTGDISDAPMHITWTNQPQPQNSPRHCLQ